MAFFSSSSYNRDVRTLKRSASTDRIRRGPSISSSTGTNLRGAVIAESAPTVVSALSMATANASVGGSVLHRGKERERERETRVKRVSPPLASGSHRKKSSPRSSRDGKISPPKNGGGSPNESPRSSTSAMHKARSSPDLKTSSSKTNSGTSAGSRQQMSSSSAAVGGASSSNSGGGNKAARDLPPPPPLSVPVTASMSSSSSTSPSSRLASTNPTVQVQRHKASSSPTRPEFPMASTSTLTPPTSAAHPSHILHSSSNHRPIKSSGAGSISDSTSPVEVNMKRLLSRPADTSYSSSSSHRPSSARPFETSDSEQSLGIVIPSLNKPYRSRVVTAPTSANGGARLVSVSPCTSSSSARYLSAHTSEPEYASSSSPLRGSTRARDPLPSPFIENLRSTVLVTSYSTSSSGSCSSPIVRGLALNSALASLGHSRSASVSTSLPSSPPDTPFMGGMSDNSRDREREREREREKERTRDRSARRLSVGVNVSLNLGVGPSLSPQSQAQIAQSRLSPRSAVPSRADSHSRSPSPRISPSPVSSFSRPSPTTKPYATNTTVTKRRQSPPPIPPGLTPAEIVAHQYKHQEMRREDLAKGAGEEQEIERQKEREGVDRERARRLKELKEKESIGKLDSDGIRERVRQRTMSSGRILDRRPSTVGGESTPFYTILGSPSGRVVAIGSPQDSAWTSTEGIRGRDTETRAWAYAEKSPQSSSSLSGRLTRKFSGKFKREGSRGWEERDNGMTIYKTVVTAGSDDGHTISRHTFDMNRRPSVQERRSMTLPRERRKSLKLSIDGFVAITTTEPDSGKALPSAGNGTPAKGSFVHVSGAKWELDEHGPEPAAGKKPKSKEKEKKEVEKEKCKDADGSGKLWRIVKKISSGTLKDKFHRGEGEGPPPPVPALPKELLSASTTVPFPSRLTSDRGNDSDSSGMKDTKETSGSNKLLKRARSKPSLSQGRPSVSQVPTSPVKAVGSPNSSRNVSTSIPSPPPPPTSTTGTRTTHRPSTTTRSSSPQSSTDMASLQFFQKSQSTRSSTSSLGELFHTLPPNVQAVSSSSRSQTYPFVGEPIVAPEQLYLMHMGAEEEVSITKEGATLSASAQARPRVLDRRMSARVSYADEPLNSLPVPPPRRAPANGTAGLNLRTEGSFSLSHDSSESNSPMIPTFSTENAVNTFGRKSSTSATLSAVSSSLSFGADFGVTKPVASVPPRPRRNSKRLASKSSSSTVGLTSGSSTTTTSPVSTLDVDSLRTDLFGLNMEHKVRIERESFGSHASTARPGGGGGARSEYAFSDTDSRCSSPVLVATHDTDDDIPNAIRFRELKDGFNKKTWTDQEKVDKWNDLLDRSEKAGGTLYVGVGGLLSDRLDGKFGKIRT